MKHVQDGVRVDRKAGGRLARRILLECVDKCETSKHSLDGEIDVVDLPIVVLIGHDVRAFIGIHAKIENLRNAQTGEWIRPYLVASRRALFTIDVFPVFITHAHEHAVVIEIEELLPWTVRFLTGEVRKDVEAIEMYLVH